MRRTRVWGAGLLAVAAFGLLAACGGDDEGGISQFRRGGAEVEETVEGFIRGWMRGSGPARDTIAASQTRRFLGGDLGARVANARVGGSQTEEPLERVFNDIMGLPFPPDADPPYTVTESEQISDTEATVTVNLHYTPNAASSLASLGIIGFDAVQEAQGRVNGDNIRKFHLLDDETLGWQIDVIEPIE